MKASLLGKMVRFFQPAENSASIMPLKNNGFLYISIWMLLSGILFFKHMSQLGVSYKIIIMSHSTSAGGSLLYENRSFLKVGQISIIAG